MGFTITFIIFKTEKFINLDINLNFDENSAFSIIEDQLNINSTHFRIPGTQGREDCANYFVSQFQQIDPNLTSIFHNFTVNMVECQNLLFKFNENYSNILILGAHYDSRARATKDSVNPDQPVPGANDGASGCGVLIELASSIYERRNDLAVQIWFLFMDAEDQGYDVGAGLPGWDWCEGSERFVGEIENFYDEINENFDAMILLDMVGGENLQFINEQHSTSSLLEEIFEIGRKLGFTQEFPITPIFATIVDDHVPFIGEGIPSADLIINFWNNPAWSYHHTTQDDLTHISNHSLETTGKTVEQFIYNNYFKSPNNNYNGNYPWKDDINTIDTDFLTIIIAISAIVIILALGSAIYKKYIVKQTDALEN